MNFLEMLLKIVARQRCEIQPHERYIPMNVNSPVGRRESNVQKECESASEELQQ